ncbi:phosphate butyryltransferase [Salipaludibacillus keqinensis]|uniref:Phosphate butyryltransferase n=1 Tax=Salipaludibacillus keqinensis TaxID=2045207 RepID=A0A323THQ3_9BACI|nr:bifunctional enoyl-CoA hydratase/phosphate acetyltransferase [Salipaludibacillus keqinensis]PYZ94368.1 phosphate butyryltransferase [Salipaludibacillus keqinensis]
MNLDTLLEKIQQQREQQTIAIAHATDPSVFKSAEKALQQNLASFIFIGPEAAMIEAKQKASFSFDLDNRVDWFYTLNEVDSARLAVKLVKDGKAEVLMKGMIETSSLLKAVLNKEYGLRTGNILSHLAGFSFPGRSSLLFVTDAAMNISPELKEKVQIIENAAKAVQKMGITLPKVAVLAAVETVNPAMQATLDAAVLTQMNRRNQLSHCEVDGPLGFDNAISIEAADQKGIKSNVAGHADILMVPAIETGNVLYKSLTYFGQATVGGMIVGAKAPIVLTSRSDSVESKLFSMAMALSSTK